MAMNSRDALNRLVALLEMHLDAAQSANGTASSRLLDIEDRLCDAFFTYDDALYTEFGVELPFEIVDEYDEDYEDEEADDEDDEASGARGAGAGGRGGAGADGAGDGDLDEDDLDDGDFDDDDDDDVILIDEDDHRGPGAHWL